MKIIAFYLPQFHRVPENDKWWGDGFTEWVNVKKAKPLYEGHYQPRVPLGENYYDLTDEKVLEWQSKLAEDYGLYGFCFYHYWFNGKMLLEKPVDMYRLNPNCRTKYCLCWANEDWTDQWVSNSPRVLMKQTYGDRDEWKAHFEYFLPHFKDDRYIKVDNKPFLVLYNPYIINNLKEMLEYWNELAIQEGFDGIITASQNTKYRGTNEDIERLLNYRIDYQPQYAYTLHIQKAFPILRKIKRRVNQFMQKYLHTNVIDRVGQASKLKTFEYDDIWKTILETKPESDRIIPGAFVDWDNTARKQEKGFVIDHASPDKFEKYLKEQIKRAKDVYHKDMIFLFAWNEWAECGYMEPDEKFGYGYLEALKKAVES